MMERVLFLGLMCCYLPVALYSADGPQKQIICPENEQFVTIVTPQNYPWLSTAFAGFKARVEDNIRFTTELHAQKTAEFHIGYKRQSSVQARGEVALEQSLREKLLKIRMLNQVKLKFDEYKQRLAEIDGLFNAYQQNQLVQISRAILDHPDFRITPEQRLKIMQDSLALKKGNA